MSGQYPSYSSFGPGMILQLPQLSRVRCRFGGSNFEIFVLGLLKLLEVEIVRPGC